MNTPGASGFTKGRPESGVGVQDLRLWQSESCPTTDCVAYKAKETLTHPHPTHSSFLSPFKFIVSFHPQSCSMQREGLTSLQAEWLPNEKSRGENGCPWEVGDVEGLGPCQVRWSPAKQSVTRTVFIVWGHSVFTDEEAKTEARRPLLKNEGVPPLMPSHERLCFSRPEQQNANLTGWLLSRL